MSVMELIGQAEGTTLYGDRSAELVQAGGIKLFRAPFRGYVKSVSSDGEADYLIVAINNVVVNDLPAESPTAGNTFEAGDTLMVVGVPIPDAGSDRIGLEVGTIK